MSDQPSWSSLEDLNQLGPPLAVRQARTFSLLVELLLGSIWFLLSLAPAVASILIIFGGLFRGETPAFGGGLLILAFFGPLTYFGGKLMLRAWRGLGVRLHIYPEGIIYTRWRQVVGYRWEDIRAFSYKAIDRMRLGIYLDSLYHYRFHHCNGHHFVFAEELNRNTDKPITQFVEDGLVDRQLPLLRERFLQRNEEIAFGPFSLGLEGLGYKRSLLAWPEVDFIWAEDGKVRVRKKNKTLNWASARMDRVPNFCLFLILAKERLAQEEPRK